MSDLRVELAQEIADQIGAILIPGRCQCGSPMMKFHNSPGAFCWSCLTDEQTAQKSIDLLERLRRHIEVTHVGRDAYLRERKSA
jgi:hypothetical protein